MLKPLLTLLTLLLCGPAWASFEVEITQQQMQQMAEQKFPIKKQTLLANITLSNPQLSLVEQRFSLATDVSVHFPNQTMSQGSAIIDGKLGYRAEKGEFVMMQPTLVSLEVQGLSPQGNQLLQEQASQLEVQQIQSIVVYQLDEKRFRDRLTKQSLKFVSIRNGSLIAEMDW